MLLLISNKSKSPNMYILIAAVVEGRGLAKGEIGMAAIDLKGSELALFQVNSSFYLGIFLKSF